MKDTLKRFVDSKRGVSPVIGVVLMVAVVVILAAVIGAFVLGLGGDQSSAPQASFSVDNNGDLVYEGGDSIDGGDIEVTGDPADGSTGSGTLTAGDVIGSVDQDGSGTVRVVYTGNGGSTTIWQTDVGGGSGGNGGA